MHLKRVKIQHTQGKNQNNSTCNTRIKWKNSNRHAQSYEETWKHSIGNHFTWKIIQEGVFIQNRTVQSAASFSNITAAMVTRRDEFFMRFMRLRQERLFSSSKDGNFQPDGRSLCAEYNLYEKTQVREIKCVVLLKSPLRVGSFVFHWMNKFFWEQICGKHPSKLRNQPEHFQYLIWKLLKRFQAPMDGYMFQIFRNSTFKRSSK